MPMKKSVEVIDPDLLETDAALEPIGPTQEQQIKDIQAYPPKIITKIVLELLPTIKEKTDFRDGLFLLEEVGDTCKELQSKIADEVE